jgi:hypothetical protein
MNNNRLNSIGRLSETQSLQELYIYDFKGKIKGEIGGLEKKIRHLKIKRV